MENNFIYMENILFRGYDLSPDTYGDKNRKFEQNRIEPSNGFYGRGFYFSLSADEALIWGRYLVSFKLLRPLKLLVEPKSARGVNIKRKDYWKQIDEDCDGIIFGYGAEGGKQVLLRCRSVFKILKQDLLKP